MCEYAVYAKYTHAYIFTCIYIIYVHIVCRHTKLYGSNIIIYYRLDTQGPEIRTGTLKDGKKIDLKKGNHIILTTKEVIGSMDMISVNYADLLSTIKVGSQVIIYYL